MNKLSHSGPAGIAKVFPGRPLRESDARGSRPAQDTAANPLERRVMPTPDEVQDKIFRNRRIVVGVAAVLAVAGIAVGISKLEDASDNRGSLIPADQPYILHSGDTVSGLASEFCPNQPQGRVVDFIMSVNHIKPEELGLLQIGRRMTVPDKDRC